jgi:hypothetical protein
MTGLSANIDTSAVEMTVDDTYIPEAGWLNQFEADALASK